MPVESVLKTAQEVRPQRAEVDHAAQQGNARRTEDATLIAEALKGAIAEGSVELNDDVSASATAAEVATATVEADAAKKAAKGAPSQAAQPADAAKPAEDAAKDPPATTESEAVKAARRESMLTAMREEKRLREQRKAFETQKAKDAARVAELEAKAKQAEELASLAGNPLELLKKLGIKGEDMARALLGVKEEKPKTPEEAVAALKAELEAKERAKEETAKKEAAEREAKQREDWQNWRKGELEKVKKLVEKGADKYELIREFGAHDRVLAVRDHIYRHGDEEHGYAPGNVLTLDKCAELVETLIEADQKAKAQRSKKLASIYGKPAQETATTTATQARPSTGEKAKPAPTLSNRKATPTATPSEERRVLSEDELLREAIGALEWSKPA